tara:strand:+ start:328 stop:1488 length:1161 start_codon:yes stop_codon:yes gene_type:complete
MNIPFHKPCLPKDFRMIISDSIMNGWLTTGPEVKSFEKMISDYTSSEHVIAVNSCTAALHLALAAKGYGKGDKFIVPSYTFVASAEVGEYLGMEPIFVDCDENLNLDLNQVWDKVKKEKNINAIIPVHIAGNPVDMLSVRSIAEKFNIFILEDAAHALETISNHGKVGNTDYAAAFSFYANKNITTGGEGGALATNDKVLAENIRKLSLHGMSKDGWKRFQKNAKWEYDVSKLGYKYNMTDISASFGNWQMKYVKQWHASRSKLFKYYNKKLSQLDGITCPIDVSHEQIHGYHLYIIRLKSEMWSINRNKIIELLNASGIGTSVHYKPIHMHSYYQKKYGFKPIDFPNSYGFYRNAITLPLYPDLSIEQVDFIVENLILIWNKYKN